MIKACTPSRTTALTALMALAVLLPASACSSSASGGTAATSGASAVPAAQAACQQVSAVLTNGPDPGTDPVGYAEAQVQPLRQIHTSDATVGQAVTALATAYDGYFTTNGKDKTATVTLTAAISQINKLCPGAGATP
jgi:hypothetical protein